MLSCNQTTAAAACQKDLPQETDVAIGDTGFATAAAGKRYEAVATGRRGTKTLRRNIMTVSFF